MPRVEGGGKGNRITSAATDIALSSFVVAAVDEQAQAAAEQPSPSNRGGRGGARGGRGGRRGKRAASVPPEPDQDMAFSPRGGPKGKRKAAHPEDCSARQAQHAQHILKRKEKTLSCPLCLSATILSCDKLDTLSLAELKMIMG